MGLTAAAAKTLAKIVTLLDALPVQDAATVIAVLHNEVLHDAPRVQNEVLHEVLHEPLQHDAPRVQNGLHEGGFGGVCSDFFLQFWSAYPRRIGKKDALRIYQKLKPDQELQDRILRAILEQKASDQWMKENGAFIPLPSTWLNRGSWDDEVLQLPMKDSMKPDEVSFNGKGAVDVAMRGIKRWGERHGVGGVDKNVPVDDGSTARGLPAGQP